MTYLLDTNVVSELRKGARRNANVAAWFARVDDAELHVSVLVLGEIRRGAEKLRSRNPDQAKELDHWLEELASTFGGRILPIDDAAAQEWGRMSAIRSVPVVDCLLAATAASNGLTLVTRNAKDVAGLGARLLNPFESE